MDPTRRINRIICLALGFLLIASVSQIPMTDLSDSAAASGLEASEGILPASSPVPKSPEPVRLMLEAKHNVSLLSSQNVTSCTDTDMFLLLKHMKLEPLKFRSNYVDHHA